MKTLIKIMEYVAGGLLFIVMVLITASAISRYIFNAPLLDSDDIARLLLLPAIFFGFASACHHGEHIRVDLLWENLSARGQRLMDRFATLMILIIVSIMAAATLPRVMDIYASHVGTYEMRLPLWPFFAIASVGIILSAIVILNRLLTIPPDSKSSDNALHAGDKP